MRQLHEEESEVLAEFREISGKFGGGVRMAADRQFAFGPFRFDTRTGQLWRDNSELKLTPRAGAVLHVLAERAQELVTKQELFDRVWGGMAVSDDALTSCIQELRGALGDDTKRPRYIETRYRRGYRLMVPAASMVDRPRAAPLAPVPKSPTLVGRTTELQELGRGFELALRRPRPARHSPPARQRRQRSRTRG